MNIADLRRFLRDLPAFERLGEHSLDALAGQMQFEDYPAGHTLVTQSNCGAALHVVITGQIETGALSPEHGETRELAKGSIFGLLSFADIPELETYRCKEAVRMATLSRERFDALFTLAPQAARLIQYLVAVSLAQKLQAQNRALRETLHTKSISKKSVSLLKRWFGV